MYLGNPIHNVQFELIYPCTSSYSSSVYLLIVTWILIMILFVKLLY